MKIHNPYSHLSLLAKRIQKNITVFDFETTGLLDAEDLGITEIAFLSISPGGTLKRWSSLINPEGDIPSAVTAITNITNQMVYDQPTFSQVWPQISHTFSNHALFGFNSNKFDIHVLNRQLERYNIASNAQPWKSFDVRPWHQIAGNFGPKGTLRDVASLWRIPLPDNLHRAAADVEVTAGIMDALLAEHGLAPLKDSRIALHPSDSSIFHRQSKTTTNAIVNVSEKPPETTTLPLMRDALSWISSELSLNGYQPLAKLAAKTGLTQSQTEELIETSIDSNILPTHIFSHAPTQLWLNQQNRLKTILLHAYPTTEAIGKLHYPYQILWNQYLNEKPNDVILDYVQLRVAMRNLHSTYVTRRGLLEANSASGFTHDPSLDLFNSITPFLKPSKPRFFS
jgi:DNA polymerase III epsilon subunit-like protein